MYKIAFVDSELRNYIYCKYNLFPEKNFQVISSEHDP